jgi:predicted O-methyltransferase YrrM
MDISKNNIENVFYNNLVIGNVIDRVNCVKGDSKNVLVKLLIDNIKYDFIYVDGSHKCLDCYSDMVLSWNLLKTGGILGIDDYLWKPENTNDKLDLPYHAVNHFMDRYKGEYSILNIGYRVFLLKN